MQEESLDISKRFKLCSRFSSNCTFFDRFIIGDDMNYPAKNVSLSECM